jgi:hypothetical protein
MRSDTQLGLFVSARESNVLHILHISEYNLSFIYLLAVSLS